MRRTAGGKFGQNGSQAVLLFTIKSVKQVCMKRFKTTGLDYRVQFGDLHVHGLLDVLRQLHEEFESLLVSR